MSDEHPVDRLAKRLARAPQSRHRGPAGPAWLSSGPLGELISRRRMLAGAAAVTAAALFDPLPPQSARAAAGDQVDPFTSCNCPANHDFVWNSCYAGVLPKSFPSDGVAAGLLASSALHEAESLCTPQAQAATSACTQVACTHGQTCVASVFTSPPHCQCPDGSHPDFQTDNHNCGRCAKRCVSPSRCANGHCVGSMQLNFDSQLQMTFGDGACGGGTASGQFSFHLSSQVTAHFASGGAFTGSGPLSYLEAQGTETCVYPAGSTPTSESREAVGSIDGTLKVVGLKLPTASDPFFHVLISPGNPEERYDVTSQGPSGGPYPSTSDEWVLAWKTLHDSVSSGSAYDLALEPTAGGGASGTFRETGAYAGDLQTLVDVTTITLTPVP